MWRLARAFYFALLLTALFTNAVAVYLLHDVDADRIGQWNLAFRELAQESMYFSVFVAALFFLFTWAGKLLLRLPRVAENSKLAWSLGLGVVLLQYPSELAARKIAGQQADTLLLIYMLLSPICCAAIILRTSRPKGITPAEQSGASLPPQA